MCVYVYVRMHEFIIIIVVNFFQWKISSYIGFTVEEKM